MFAGPNGSGKSTLKSYLPAALLGFFLNPDEMEQSVRAQGFLNFVDYGVKASPEEVLQFFRTAPLLRSKVLAEAAQHLDFANGLLDFKQVPINSYFASVAGDFLRRKLLAQKSNFTIETVMSHPDKVDLLRQAQAVGYRTYLYYVATDDPAINASRVRNRVKLGGHSVPADKIELRYHRSLNLLMDAIRNTNRAYVFDNSGDSSERKHTLLAEITEGSKLELKTDQIPAWFKRIVLDKINLGIGTG
jgi:predicted ABC-type ATPase